VPPQISNTRLQVQQFPFLADSTGFAVLHPHPQWIYKQWTVEGWIELGFYLKKLGLRLVLSGGPAQKEIDYVANIQSQLPEDTINLAGLVSLAQLTYIIAKAKLYIGPDTGITHLAAATGIPVIALYGPTNPVKWAPFPYGYQANDNPFDKIGDKQVNNIYFVQGEGGCVPCDLEGCDRNRQSRSQCLDNLPAERIKRLVRQLLIK
jgi:heptosyltransferase-3